MNEYSEAKSGKGAGSATGRASGPSEVILAAEKLSKWYRLGRRKVLALSELDLQIRRGEFVAIMGQSGSGKTTLLNVLGCLDEPSSGKVKLEGLNLGEMGVID